MPKRKKTKEATITSVPTLRSNMIKFKKLKADKKLLEDDLTKLNEKIGNLELKLFEGMQALDVSKLTTSGYTFFQKASIFFSYNPDMEDAQTKAKAWVKKYHPELLSFNMKTLNSFLKDLVEKKKSNKAVPKFFKQTSRNQVGLRKI